MVETIHEHISNAELHRIAIFGAAALFGMLFAYIKRWSDNEIPVPLMKYLAGDSHAVARACTTLVLLLGGAEAMGHLITMTDMQILSSGAAVGLMVPSVADSKKAESIAYQEWADRINEAAAANIEDIDDIKKDPM